MSQYDRNFLGWATIILISAAILALAVVAGVDSPCGESGRAVACQKDRP